MNLVKTGFALNPIGTSKLFGRDGFAIHGRGKIGSHGRIVPYDFNVLLKMVQILKKHPDKKFSLEVVSIGANIGWEKRLG